MKTVIRKRKDGGYSECSSPDNLVGRGRCCHVLDVQSFDLTKIHKNLYEVNIDDDNSFKMEGGKQSIIKFFNSLQELEDEKINEIINWLEKE